MSSTELATRPQTTFFIKPGSVEDHVRRAEAGLRKAEQAIRLFDYLRQPATCDGCGYAGIVDDMYEHSETLSLCTICYVFDRT